MVRLLLLTFVVLSNATAAEPLTAKIDDAIRTKAGQAPLSPPADDAEFIRRVYLDLAGHIPTRNETHRFLHDRQPDKRSRLINQLLASSDYPKRMADQFHVMYMERLGEHADWSAYLQQSFAKNKPWNMMAKEILRADSSNTEAKGASFFISKRLENYGQQAVDYSALTRDIGRLFLGKNLQCAECHDHLFIPEYKQHDFKGLFAFVQNAYLSDEKTATVGEKPLQGKIPFSSVFKKVPREIGPTIPGGKEIEVKTFKKGEEYAVPPEPKVKKPGQLKFSPLALLSEQLTTAETADFSRNFVNRIWFMFLGRGLVHPLDLHHADNPASHPAVLTLLAEEFVKHQYDIKWLISVITQTEVYQRSSKLPTGITKAEPAMFTTALEKRLSAEQLLASFQTALGVTIDANGKAKIIKAYANTAREPEDEIAPMLKGALFLLNDPLVLGWLEPKSNPLLQQWAAKTDADLPMELYLTILSRQPSASEQQTVQDYLKKHASNRPTAVSRIAWALLASTEFGINH